MAYTLGESIKNSRIKQNISQSELAEELHVTRQTISSWERNIAIPDEEIIEKIKTILDLSQHPIEETPSLLSSFLENTKKIVPLIIIMFIISLTIGLGIYINYDHIDTLATIYLENPFLVGGLGILANFALLLSGCCLIFLLLYFFGHRKK